MTPFNFIGQLTTSLLLTANFILQNATRFVNDNDVAIGTMMISVIPELKAAIGWIGAFLPLNVLFLVIYLKIYILIFLATWKAVKWVAGLFTLGIIK